MKKAIVAAALTLGAAGQAFAGGPAYEVSVTNLSPGLQFTPILVVAHNAGIALWEGGAEASPELALLAEDGDTSALEGVLAGVPDLVSDFGASEGLLDPGKSVSVIVGGGDGIDRISLAAMLLPTNDSFVGGNSLRVPRVPGATRTYFVVGYDAGSEPNDEDCANIPGPVCGGVGASPDEGGEGFVHVSRGIAGNGSLSAAGYDWRNPVARVDITRTQ